MKTQSITDSKGNQLFAGDYFKYRSVFSPPHSRTRKNFIGKVEKVNSDDSLECTILKGDVKKALTKYPAHATLEYHRLMRGGAEKLSEGAALLIKLEYQ